MPSRNPKRFYIRFLLICRKLFEIIAAIRMMFVIPPVRIENFPIVSTKLRNPVLADAKLTQLFFFGLFPEPPFLSSLALLYAIVLSSEFLNFVWNSETGGGERQRGLRFWT